MPTCALHRGEHADYALPVGAWEVPRRLAVVFPLLPEAKEALRSPAAGRDSCDEAVGYVVEDLLDCPQIGSVSAPDVTLQPGTATVRVVISIFPKTKDQK